MADRPGPALCAGLTGLFYAPPSETEQLGVARALCHVCPRQLSCLEGALARREPAGVWGGIHFPDEARALARRRARENQQRARGAA